MTTEIRADKSAPLAMAASLLSVCVSAAREYRNPEHASVADIANVVRTARGNLKSVLDAGYETKIGAIFKAVDILILAEAYLITEACLQAGRIGESPIRGALETAVELIDRELESMVGESTAPAGGDGSASGEVTRAA